MIITDRFVMLNYPKTGSSFARKVIKQLYAKYDTLPYKVLRVLGIKNVPGIVELLLPMMDTEAIAGKKSQHGSYRQIPPEHRRKPIVSVTRNPFDRYLSAYLFRWWVKHPLVSTERLVAQYPQYPDLSFREYYDMLHTFGLQDRLKSVTPKSKLGFHTVRFVQFYFPDPVSVLNRLDESYVQQKKYVDDMAKVTFLHQENLNQELYEFLLRMGYPEKQIAFIKDAEKYNVTQRTSEQVNTADFYTPELIEQVIARDRLLFEIFPEYKSFSL